MHLKAEKSDPPYDPADRRSSLVTHLVRDEGALFKSCHSDQ